MSTAFSIPHFYILVAVEKRRCFAISFVEQKQHALKGGCYTRKYRTSQIIRGNMLHYRKRILKGFPDEMFSQVYKRWEPEWYPVWNCFLEFRTLFPEPAKRIGRIHYDILDGIRFSVPKIPRNFVKNIGQGPHLNEMVVRARTAWTRQKGVADASRFLCIFGCNRL